MKTQRSENEMSASADSLQMKSAEGKSMTPPPFSLTSGGGDGVAQKQDAGGGESSERETASASVGAAVDATHVVDTTRQAWSHYMHGNGSAVDIGPNTINSLLASESFLSRHNRITGGLTTSLNGNFSVDMTGTVFHIGRTNVDYDVQCDGDNCTVTYTLFGGDGFWDVDFIDENTLGRLGLDRYQPDGMGPNLERFGGSPYPYNTATRSFTFKNPGY